MAEPFLQCPPDWRQGTLAPSAVDGLILQVDTGSTPLTSNEEYWDGGIPWLTPKEITWFTNNLFVTRTERTISRAGLENSSARIMSPGTVMLSKRAPVGAVAVNAVPMATNQGFLNFTCGPHLRPLYFAYWLRANKPYLDMVANGSTYPEIYVTDLFEFEIAVPPIEVQDKVLELIGALQFVSGLGLPLEQAVTSTESLLSIQDQNRRLSDLREALLPLLLSGNLNVVHINTRFMQPQ